MIMIQYWVVLGIEGVCVLLEKITENLEVQAFGVNYLSKFQEDSFPKMAEKLLPVRSCSVY